MEILKEMVQVLTKYKTRQIEILGNPTDQKSQVYEFYDLIADGTFQTDEDAAAYFFDGNVRNQSYKNLKTRLKNRLINTVFFVEANDSMFNEYEKAYVNCYRDWAAAKILAGKSAKKSAISLCVKILRQAQKADFLDIIIEVCRFLRYQYGVVRYDKKKFGKYNELLKESLIIREKELFMEECYLNLIPFFIESKPSDSKLVEIASAYEAMILKDFEQYNSFLVLYNGGMIKLVKLMALNDYVTTVTVCEKIIKRFEAKPFIWAGGINAFFMQKLICHVQLKEFEKGNETIDALFDYLEEGTFNWFKGLELQMYLLFYTKNYQEIYTIYKKTVGNKRFNYLPQTTKESWSIFKAYLHFLINAGEVHLEIEDKAFSKFRLGKFLNEVPAFSQDKRGRNIAILVIQIIFTIVQKKYIRAIQRIEAIEKYSFRYLKKDTNFRSNCFIKMLLVIPKEGFHRIAVERKTANLRKRLDEVPLEIANQSHSIEIIPYEDLWEMVLGILGTKRYR
ncbi:MAG: hypothetical protein AAF960_23695 [Bacteroidota bacterium]